MNKLFSYFPLWQEKGITIIRIITGGMLIYHGWEVFDPEKMAEYAVWDTFKNNPYPSLMVYLGKGSEFVTGILLVAGFLTRVAAIIVMITFTYIAFFVGNGKILYEDQHPFLFVLLALVFFFSGAGKWSIDRLIAGKLERRGHKT